MFARVQGKAEGDCCDLHEAKRERCEDKRKFARAKHAPSVVRVVAVCVA